MFKKGIFMLTYFAFLEANFQINIQNVQKGIKLNVRNLLEHLRECWLIVCFVFHHLKLYCTMAKFYILNLAIFSHIYILK